MAPMPQPSLIASAVYYPPTNKIYVFGGATRAPDPIITYDTTLIYDVMSNTWSSGAAMPAPRYQMAHGYNWADGKIYLNGGYEGSGIDTVQATTWRYDPVADSFTDLAPSPTAHGGPASGIIAGQVNGHFLVAGGRTYPDETLVATWDYDIASNTWTQKQDMPKPTNVPGSAVVLSASSCRSEDAPRLRATRSRGWPRSRASISSPTSGWISQASITRDRSPVLRSSEARCSP